MGPIIVPVLWAVWENERYHRESPEISVRLLGRAATTSGPLSCLLWAQEESLKLVRASWSLPLPPESCNPLEVCANTYWVKSPWISQSSFVEVVNSVPQLKKWDVWIFSSPFASHLQYGRHYMEYFYMYFSSFKSCKITFTIFHTWGMDLYLIPGPRFWELIWWLDHLG